MKKEGYDHTPSAPMPTAPPPSYDSTFPQLPYNPNIQTSLPPYQYQPAPVIHELPGQQDTATASYASHSYYPQQVTTIRENTIIVPLLVGPQPLQTTCPNCRALIKTKTTKETKGLAFLICIGLCLICCWPCSCLPYCVDSLKEIRHTCPNCKAHLGTYSS